MNSTGSLTSLRPVLFRYYVADLGLVDQVASLHESWQLLRSGCISTRMQRGIDRDTEYVLSLKPSPIVGLRGYSSDGVALQGGFEYLHQEHLIRGAEAVSMYLGVAM